MKKYKYIIVIALLILGTALAGIFYWNNSKNIPPTVQNQSQQKTGDLISKINDNEKVNGQQSKIEDIKKPPQNLDYTTAIIKTNFGDIKLRLFDKDASNTVKNFVELSKSGFYDGVKFHRVIKGFMIQTGDPNSKDNNWFDDGTGGPGYAFPDEINSHKIVKGTLAMANSGSNTNGSQFFILTGASAPWLDGRHTVFGKVEEGMDAAIKIENVETDKSRNDHPIQDIVIKTIEI